MSGSDISWAVCKSAPRSRQIITMPAPTTHFFTGQIPFLPPNQQRQSTKGIREIKLTCFIFILLSLSLCLQCCFDAVGWASGRACKNWRCHLSGARCRLFAYGLADATVSQNPIISCPQLNPDWFYLSCTGLPRLCGKEAITRV